MSQADLDDVELVAIGGSAGCFEVLRGALPATIGERGCPPIVIVVHLPSEGPALLHELLGTGSELRMKQAADKEPVERNTVYFAPPGYHLLVERQRTLALSVDEAVHYSRPSIDVLFESVAWAYGPRALGVLLSGASEDGAAGLQRIAEAGGTVAVQDPASALAPTMPAAALRRLPQIERRLNPSQIGHLLGSLAHAR